MYSLNNCSNKSRFSSSLVTRKYLKRKEHKRRSVRKIKRNNVFIVLYSTVSFKSMIHIYLKMSAKRPLTYSCMVLLASNR